MPRLGRSQSQETRNKISKSLTGRKRPPEVGQKVSKATKGIPRGPRSGMYYIDVLATAKGREFRKSIFKLDDYTCQRCGVTQDELLVKLAHRRAKSLHPHHIKDRWEFPQLAFTIENCVTLCPTCHTSEEWNPTFTFPYIRLSFT
jgi:hypothetical protein